MMLKWLGGFIISRLAYNNDDRVERIFIYFFKKMMITNKIIYGLKLFYMATGFCSVAIKNGFFNLISKLFLTNINNILFFLYRTPSHQHHHHHQSP